MEENQNGNGNGTNPNVGFFRETLNKESAHIGYPNESPLFALNANVEGFRGNAFRYQTEQGNEMCFNLPEGYIPIGKIYIEDNTLAVFSTDNTNSEIGLVKDCQYETLINAECLYFSTEYPVSGQSRIRKGCDRIIYWRDSYNSDRWLNIDEYLRCKEFDCNLITFNPQVLEPCIELVSVNNQGGFLELGTYSFGVEILDKNENLVHRSDLTRKIPIYDEFTTDSYENIDGGHNIAIYSPEIGGVPKTTKSISLRFTNLNTDFAFLRVFVRYANTGDGQVTTSHYVGNLIPITSTEETFTYSGYNVDNGDFQIPNTQTVIPKVIYDRSKAMEQVQGRLLRANVSEPYIDVSEYQKAASKIWTEWTSKSEKQEFQKCLKLTGMIYSDSEECNNGVEYTITYKVDNQSKTVSDKITFKGTSLNSQFEINQVIECAYAHSTFTDINLTFNCLKEGSCKNDCTLDYFVELVERNELNGSSKDPNTYWMDSTFMDDEIYAFGIVFEHANGYKSPVFHIPGIAKDSIIEDGDCKKISNVPDDPILYKCLYIEGQLADIVNCVIKVEYNISYKINGISYFASDTLLMDNYGSAGEIFPIYIYRAEITDVISDVILTSKCTAIPVNFPYHPDCQPNTELECPLQWGVKVCNGESDNYEVQQCISIVGDIYVPNDKSIVKLDYTLNFKVNNIPNTITGTLDFDLNLQSKYQLPKVLYCGNENDLITEISLDTVCTTISIDGPVTEQGTCLVFYELSYVTTGNENTPGVELDSDIIQTWSEDLIPFIDLSASEYNSLPDSQKLERWQVYNTARGNTSGRMAYYECKEAVYQKPDSCCISDYWGKDYCGNALEGTPIRHHKFPCKSMLPGAGYKLGVVFNNVNYPSEDIVSHFFVVGKRTENNKTVLDQGFAGNLGKDKTRTAFSFFQPNIGTATPGKGFPDCRSKLDLDTERLWYMTPRMLFNKEYINGGYIKLIKKVSPLKRNVKVIEVDEVDTRSTQKTDVFLGTRINCYGNYQDKINSEKRYYPIYKNYIIDPYSEYQDGTQLITNISNTNKIGIIRSDKIFELFNGTLALISFKVNRDVYCNLETIQYLRLHNCNLTINNKNSYEIYGGDVFNSRPTIANSFIWKVNKNYLQAVGAVAALIVIVAAAFIIPGVAPAAIAAIGLTPALSAVIGVIAALGAGYVQNRAIETFLNDFLKKKFVNFLCDRDLNKALDKIDEDLEDYVAVATEFINNFELTSEVNGELRHSGVSICGTYPRFVSTDGLCSAEEDKIYGYLRDRLTYYDEENKEIKVLQLLCPEFYGYNKDYSLVYGEKVYFSLPRTYDFCRACTNEFKNTIIYSEKSFDTEEKDSYLVNLINNVVDIPAHRGEIFNVKHRTNILYIQCKESTFVMQPNPQVMKTDKDLVVLGTGDFLALPPQEMMQTDVGYGGSQSTTAYCNTEHGYVWLDQSKGEIYSIGQGVEEISQMRMEPWFKENLPSVFAQEFFKTTGEEYPFLDAITDPKGLGVMMVYDPKHERLIIHKKDYRPLQEINIEDGKEDIKKIYFDGDSFYRYDYVRLVKGKVRIPIQLTNKIYFENKSWTISYSLKYKKWISYHSYMPYFMYNDRNYYYTADGSKLYRHLHNGNYLTYYGIKFPFMIEGVNTHLVTSSLHHFEYISTSEVFNNDTQTFILKPEVTFNKAYFYNTDETTGLLDLLYINQHTDPYANILLPEGTKSVIYTDENYKISGIRDVSNGSPVTSRGWSDIQSYFNVNGTNHGYIDLVPINYDYGVNPYELKEVNDKLMIYRLIYEPKQDDVRLSIILTMNHSKPSRR